MVVGNPYRLSVDCWCECVKELVLACCHNSGFSMPELSVPRFGPVFGAVYSVLKFLVRWASGCSRRVLMMQGGVIRVNVCWDTYSVCQAVDENNEQDRA